MSDTVKGVVFIEDAINLGQDELKERFKEAVDNNEINHFEIISRGKKWLIIHAVGLMLNSYREDQEQNEVF